MKRASVVENGTLTHVTWSSLGDLQRLVGGNVRIIPHRKGYNAPYIAYVNEEGLLKDLPQNVLAAYVLDELGFRVSLLYGPVVIMKKGERSLLDKDQSMLDALVLRIIEEDDAGEPD